MSISPTKPDGLELDEISEKVTASEAQVENARSVAITEDDDEDFEFTFGKFLACAVRTSCSTTYTLLNIL